MGIPKISPSDFYENFVKPSGDDFSYDKMRSCTLKYVHSTMISAIMEARLQTKRFGCRYVPYRCRYCEHWHVGKE